jgi:hypothetical protein
MVGLVRLGLAGRRNKATVVPAIRAMRLEDTHQSIAFDAERLHVRRLGARRRARLDCGQDGVELAAVCTLRHQRRRDARPARRR